MKVVNVNKYYETKNGKLHILKDINAEFHPGKFYAIMGRSGSGKSTLINILGLLDDYDKGIYIIDNNDVSKFSEKEKAFLRSQKIGFVFQSFYLNQRLTALENVILPTLINKNIEKEDREKNAINILKKLGLENRVHHFPNQLSGGEQQRVAIARALINNPSVIIADEPTGNLDSKHELEIFEILKEISTQEKIVIVVSHNDIVKNYCDKLYTLDDGVIYENN